MVEPHTRSWTSNWTRLESIVFLGASVYEKGYGSDGFVDNLVPAFVQHAGRRPSGSKLLQVTYDFRAVDIEEDDAEPDPPSWVCARLARTLGFTILALTSHEGMQRSLQADCAGSDYMEVRLESKAGVADLLAEMESWRKGGMAVGT